ncbi:MAG TPA: hypothetical protein VK210_09325 [Terriglobia bacterium]|nr:hypothetical protein [Terriglobia bacterium]
MQNRPQNCCSFAIRAPASGSVQRVKTDDRGAFVEFVATITANFRLTPQR